MLIYGKPLRVLKPGDPTVEVFRQVHLGFLETKAIDIAKFSKSKSIKSRDASQKKKTREGSSSAKSKTGGLDAMFTVMVFYDEDKVRTTQQNKRLSTASRVCVFQCICSV